MSDDSEPLFTKRELKKVGLVAGISLAVIALAIALTPMIIGAWSNGWDKAAVSGPFGDQFGLANAVFSGLAFVAVSVTLTLQTIEFREQRKLSERQQDSLDDQAKTQIAYVEELKQQSASAKEQADSLFFSSFESYFLTNIQMLIGERDRIVISHGRHEQFSGPHAFQMAIRYLHSDYKRYLENMPLERRADLGEERAGREAVIESYKRMYFAGHESIPKYISQFGFFLALFTACCDRVASLKVRPDDREKYFDILRSVCIGDFGAFIYYHAVSVSPHLLGRLKAMQLMRHVPPTSLYRGTKDAELEPTIQFDSDDPV